MPLHRTGGLLGSASPARVCVLGAGVVLLYVSCFHGSETQTLAKANPHQPLAFTPPTRCLTLPDGGWWPLALRSLPDGETKFLFPQSVGGGSRVTHGVIYSLPDGIKDRGFALDSQDDPALYITSATFSPDGKLLVVEGWVSRGGNALYLCDGATGKTKSVLYRGDLKGCNEIAFSSSGTLIACNGMDRRAAAVYDIAKGKWRHTFRHEEGPVERLAFSPDGKILATAGGVREIHLWDVKSGKRVRTIPKDKEGGYLSVAFSPDGRLLAAAVFVFEALTDMYHCDILLYDSATGKQVGTLVGHTEMILGVAFRRDGRLLVSASHDRTLKFWDVQRRKKIHEIRMAGQVQAIAQSRDGRWLVIAGDVAGKKSTGTGLAVFDMLGIKKEKPLPKR